MKGSHDEAPDRVRVDLADRSYDILIGHGLLARAGDEITARLPGARVAIVTDTNVARLHLPAMQEALSTAGVEHGSIIRPAGEPTKSWDGLTETVDDILNARLERGDVVLALGGGVIGDLAGFAAAVTRRGMRFVQAPTSLLAQVDSSVGGKTGINARQGKNLIGAFYQPDLVLADTSVLDTLPSRDFCAGYAEVVKYGLIDDPTFYAWLEDNWQSVFAGGPERATAIARSCRAKARVVAADERETGIRALLNLGHTFGHALEAATEYNPERLVHGEGVAIGMVLAFRFSAFAGLANGEIGDRVEAHLRTVGLPTRITDIPGAPIAADELMRAIEQDKKVKRGKLTFILARGIGAAFIADDVPPGDVRRFLTMSSNALT